MPESSSGEEQVRPLRSNTFVPWPKFCLIKARVSGYVYFFLIVLQYDVELRRVQIERVNLAQCQERRQQLVRRFDAGGWGSKTHSFNITKCEYVDESQEET